MTTEYLVPVLISGGLGWYVLGPLLWPSGLKAVLPVPNKDRQLEDLQLRKEEVMLTLKDLELDYKMHKISEEDYRSLYDETFQQGTSLLKQIDAVQKAPTPVVNAPAQDGVGKSTAAAKFCSECGAPLVANAKFCTECGRKVGP